MGQGSTTTFWPGAQWAPASQIVGAPKKILVPALISLINNRHNVMSTTVRLHFNYNTFTVRWFSWNNN
jgi:hypothetical protein